MFQAFAIHCRVSGWQLQIRHTFRNGQVQFIVAVARAEAARFHTSCPTCPGAIYVKHIIYILRKNKKKVQKFYASEKRVRVGDN